MLISSMDGTFVIHDYGLPKAAKKIKVSASSLNDIERICYATGANQSQIKNNSSMIFSSKIGCLYDSYDHPELQFSIHVDRENLKKYIYEFAILLKCVDNSHFQAELYSI